MRVFIFTHEVDSWYYWHFLLYFFHTIQCYFGCPKPMMIYQRINMRIPGWYFWSFQWVIARTGRRIKPHVVVNGSKRWPPITGMAEEPLGRDDFREEHVKDIWYKNVMWRKLGKSLFPSQFPSLFFGTKSTYFDIPFTVFVLMGPPNIKYGVWNLLLSYK